MPVCKDRVPSVCNGRFLHLAGTGIAGTIPTGVAQLTKLQYLSLSYNTFVGTIPSELGALTGLRSAIAFCAYIVPCLSIDSTRCHLLRMFMLFAHCRELHLDYNSLSGTVPSTFSKLTSLRFLEFSTNAITGAFPPSMSALRQLT